MGSLDHADHVRLLRGGVGPSGGRWADLGAGRGAFTLALADLLGPGGRITAVDRDRRTLRDLSESMAARFPTTQLEVVAGDFTDDHGLDDFDGVVMANSLHFLRDKRPALLRVHDMLSAGGRLVLVEYGADRGNTWVPYPISFKSWQQIAAGAGFGQTRQLAAVPSRFLGNIYAALSVVDGRRNSQPGEEAPRGS